MTSQPSPGVDDTVLGGSTLDAVRQARAGQFAWRRRMLPFTIVIVVGVIYVSARERPGIGLHGASLGLSLGLVGFIVGGVGIRRTLFMHKRSPRVYWPFLVVLLVSSVLLMWVQPTGPGAGGCVITTAIAISLQAIPAGVGTGLIVTTICLAAWLITSRGHHQGPTDYLGSVFSFTGLFLYAMLVWRVRQNDEQSRRLLVQMEETRDAELRAAALGERQRLAREMHDVLAHSLSGLVVQLEGARLLAVSDPTDQRLAGTIDRAHQLAKSGLDEARQAISMLRDDELPGPAKLAVLARSFEADTGLPCRYTETGAPRELRSAVRLALYRVTQEALTNVRKHATPDRVDVRLEYLPTEVTLTVEDFADCPAPAPPPARRAQHSGGFRGAVPPGQHSGYGLTGMRERAELLGGTLTAGPAGHGFCVRLAVPA